MHEKKLDIFDIFISLAAAARNLTAHPNPDQENDVSSFEEAVKSAIVTVASKEGLTDSTKAELDWQSEGEGTEY